MNLTPLEFLRRGEEVDDIDIRVRNAIERDAAKDELLKLRAEAAALLERVEKDLP